MKELSIEEKARAYDEAIEGIQEILSSGQDSIKMSRLQLRLQGIFPELKQSEDERIRKEILRHFVEKRNMLPTKVVLEEWIAWLEKQSEEARNIALRTEYEKGRTDAIAEIQKSDNKIIPIFRVGDVIKLKNGNGDTVIVSQVDTQHQCYCYKAWDGAATIHCDFNIDEQDEWELAEQKPAKNIVETWKDMRLEVYQQASGNRHEPNYSDDTTKMFSLNDIDEIIEKISEQGPAVVIPKFSVGDVMRTLQEAADNITSGLPVVVSIDKEYYHCTNELIALKNQGDYEYPPMNRIQKPVDKSEAKFKIEEGKWYTCTQTHVLSGKIVAIKGQTYKSNQDGAIEGEGGHLFIDKTDGKAQDYFKPWAIQDAKDGDVLASGAVVFIFKVIHGVWLNCHCSAHKDGSFNADSYDLLKDKYFSEVYPATKEQCDLLFKKMKEAGYEWDAEKKGLKKIEQNPADKVEPIEGEFPYNNPADTLKGEIDNIWRNLSCDNKFSATKEGFEEVIRHFINFVRQKPAWSEEDEETLGWLCTFLKEHGNLFYGGNEGNVIDWLKSLRDRYTWKPSDLPHWKKSTLPNDNTTGFNRDYFCYKGYDIDCKELFEKLPKDD